MIYVIMKWNGESRMLNLMSTLVSPLPLEIKALYKYVTHNWTQVQSFLTVTEEINIIFIMVLECRCF